MKASLSSGKQDCYSTKLLSRMYHQIPQKKRERKSPSWLTYCSRNRKTKRVSPSVKAAYPGRICQGISVGKDRGAIILLDEFEKVRDEGLRNMLGNVLDIKKNKD